MGMVDLIPNALLWHGTFGLPLADEKPLLLNFKKYALL